MPPVFPHLSREAGRQSEPWRLKRTTQTLNPKPETLNQKALNPKTLKP